MLSHIKKEMSIKKAILIMILLGVAFFTLSQFDSFLITKSYFNNLNIHKMSKAEHKEYSELKKNDPAKYENIKDDILRYSLRMPSEKISKLSGNDIATQSFVAQDPYIKRANIFFRNTDGAATKGTITVSVIDKKGKKVCSSSLKAGLVNNDSMTMFDFTDDSEELNQNRIIQKKYSLYKKEGISINKGERYKLQIKCSNVSSDHLFGIHLCNKKSKDGSSLYLNGNNTKRPFFGAIAFLHLNIAVYFIFIAMLLFAFVLILLPLDYIEQKISQRRGKETDLNIILSRLLFIFAPFVALFVSCKALALKTSSFIYLLLSLDGALNLFVLTALLFTLYLIINRTKYATLSFMIIALVFSIANYLLVQFRNSPLVAADFSSIGTAMDVAANYTIAFTKGSFWMIITAVIYICLTILLKSYKGLNLKKRSALLLIYFLFAGCGYWLFLSKNAVANRVYISGFDAKRSYTIHGSPLGFVLTIKAIRIEKPEDYSLELVNSITSEYESDKAVSSGDKTKRPNIIAIMNEAYSDLSYVAPFRTTGDYMPFYNSLKDNTIKGRLHTSVFGGNTANTEYEFLTGNTLAFMPMRIVAYNSKVKENAPSINRNLQDNGYGGSIAFHPGMKNSYNRDVVYKNFGFKKYISLENLKNPKKIRAYVSDEYDFNRIITEYNNYKEKKSDKPFWLFNVTIQNHSDFKYSSGVVDKQVRIIDEAARQEQAEQYLNLIKKTDEALEKLIAYYSAINEPTVIVMFGDHQPRVEDTFYTAIESHGKYNSSLDRIEHRYQVPFMIWANYDIKEESDINISANYLGAFLMEKLELPMTGYEKYLMDLYKKVPVITSVCNIDKDGNISKNDDVKNYSKELKQYQCLEYNNVVDFENREESFFRLRQ